MNRKLLIIHLLYNKPKWQMTSFLKGDDQINLMKFKGLLILLNETPYLKV